MACSSMRPTHAGEYYLCIPSSWEQIQWFFAMEEFSDHIRTHWVRNAKKANEENTLLDRFLNAFSHTTE